MPVQYWLCKSEPGDWSISDHEKKGIEHWDGVRNYQANNNMKLMKIGDLAFMYHSISDKSVVGILKCVREHYPDHTDKSGRFGMVDCEFVSRLKRPVHLEEFKVNPILANTALIKQQRLSVMPLTKSQWDEVLRLSGEESLNTNQKFLLPTKVHKIIKKISKRRQSK
jgi:predicted RNA-binding protein with PUA-like domain